MSPQFASGTASRANTESMMNDDLESLEGDLVRIIEAENAAFLDRYSYLGDVNMEFSYPIMQRTKSSRR
ncbi:MAG: hypothetical protein IPN69_11930 [Acidobacteria bacterium]|nr:hypothetical protein [Acidobacteriota bacterium]MBK8811425.1 hypothetical protein [Acidobacteriota bacterium]